MGQKTRAHSVNSIMMFTTALACSQELKVFFTCESSMMERLMLNYLRIGDNNLLSAIVGQANMTEAALFVEDELVECDK